MMTEQFRSLASLVAVLTAPLLTLAQEVKSPASNQRFAVANVRFEQNATDGDVEVVFEITGRQTGLSKLTIVSPDGRTVVDFTAPDDSTLGIREFLFESPEPTDVKGLKAAYPEGVYVFDAATASGERLHGESKLSHALPAVVSFKQPHAGARDVAARNLEITWTPNKKAAAYIVEIEQDDLHVNLTAKLPGSMTTFAVPNGFLRPGTEYQLGIGSVGDDGNVSFVETDFTTAE